ncbi:alpha-hydroxy acid oxidase [Pseudonocardia endophytica]|uniref:L-lactate dehydrogenase (Cytochrome)/(S)-mandelate dehydrogenase n=1 Tax=Pseudonocardia endophytica TaxID=401976 RepID=A0A4R1HXT8_PSEEN|nr:alpha-hydroxy acid oxidase [Pseudonocardia endophytica]TCK25935.1 L-lactate dehydrogenase (cytochrome)/(S)-mandelate dehydrogenase [Pseudonocardia endophytica]
MHAFGFDLHWRAPERLITVEDYRRAARRRLPSMVWTYVDGGADDRHTLGLNRSAFDGWWLRPSVLTGHDVHRLGTTAAGLELSMPVMLAPTGFTGLTRWSGDLDAVRAAERAGTRYALSTTSSWSLEEVAGAASREHVFQLYPGTGGVAADLMRRAWSAGYRTLFVTVDVPVKGNREGERKLGMGIPPALTPRRALNFARHPRWTYDMLRHQRVAGANVGTGGGVREAVESVEIAERELMQSRLDWDDLAWMREQWRGRLYLKGVLRADDATRAVDLGCDGVVVSNHGGRQLDHVPPTIAVLPGIADAVGHRAEVILDGGVRRGTDVVTALALGARAVLVGRPYVYGLAVGGERGVVDVLGILRDEIERALTLLGVRDVADLDRSHVRRADPPHHEELVP